VAEHTQRSQRPEVDVTTAVTPLRAPLSCAQIIEAVRQAARWRDQRAGTGLPALWVAVNVSARQLRAHLKHAADIIRTPLGACPKAVMTATAGGRVFNVALTGEARYRIVLEPRGTEMINVAAGRFAASTDMRLVASAGSCPT
jgi:hypothetical protein